MSRTVSKFAILSGATALALTPVAASAGTRAGDDTSVYSSSAAQPGMGREAKGESAVGGGFSFVSILIGAYIGAWTTLFVSEITEDDEFQSAGI
ncbi:hypothetical protein INR77_00350 [Erythrobacter sp. SCSIO 43205]|uniref:hypothetical protein n=1 Tax=Erythrobacter sp. SCSIO 43205 TaxID=2779361 RepID=UPI001CA8131A|nr:hypothetical protein [Erythrobacter sp. SCSIO 43205]UAB78244.1 hypothetical protein INR77_00350 [Erythrobacter sp. SCSIO 43205]